MKSFNLLDEPWIKVLTTTGQDAEVSLLDIFDPGSAIQAIRGETATQDVAILRLLLAITHRALEGPRTVDDWAEAWENQDEATRRITGYLEKYRNRFDLRDPERPFFQVAGIHAPSGKVSDLSSLIIDVPNGAPFFTLRRREGLEQISWAEAARWLVHVHAFDPSGIRSGAAGDKNAKNGKSYPIGPGWSGQLGLVVVEDDTLFRTILRNTVPIDVGGMRLQIDPARDLPPWERGADPVGAAEDRIMAGPVSCYTWQTRRVLLIGNDEAVTSLFLGNGDKATPQGRFTVEPLSAWRYSDPQTKKFGTITYMPREHRAERAFWRNLNSLVAGIPDSRPLTNKNGDKIPGILRPAVIEWQSILAQEELVPSTGLQKVRAVGLEYGAQQAVVTELIDTRLELPSALLNPENSELASIVAQALRKSDEVAGVIRELARNLAVASGGSGDDKDHADQDAARIFYQQAGREFTSWLRGLDAEERDLGKLQEQWRQTLRRLAQEQAAIRADAAPTTALAGRKVGPHNYMSYGVALRFFRASLNRVLPRPTAQTASHHASTEEEK